MNHLIGPLMPQIGQAPRFAQIYTIDPTQEQADARLAHHATLREDSIRTIIQAFRFTNPFVHGLKNCRDRYSEHPHPSQARIVLRQVDPIRSERGTHNKPTVEEVATVLADIEGIEGRNPIHRDIVVETKEGGLQRIPYWHSSYMALRYPVLFPYGEPSWQATITRYGNPFLPEDHFLGPYRRNRQRDTLQNIDDTRYLEELDDERARQRRHEEDRPPDYDTTRRGRGGATRVTMRAFYRKLIMVSRLLTS